MKSRVDFVYSDDFVEHDPEKYWRKLGKKRNDQLESFVGKHKAMEEAVASIVPQVTRLKSSCRRSMPVFSKFEIPHTKQKKRSKNRSARRRRSQKTSRISGKSNTETACS